MTIYNVKTPLFEGPLDLLLHLISQAEVDIYDIPVATITDQYLDFIHTMQELELDIASEYLVMAATLLQIKSQMLLPKPEELFDESEQWLEEDPRDELVEQLIEYKTYKEAAKHLKDQEEVRHSLHTRKPEELDHFLTDEEERQLQIQNVTLVDMLGAFQKMLQRNAWNRPKTKVVHTEEQSVEQRIVELLDKLDETYGPTRFSDLVEPDDRSSMIVSFLAILELIKTSTIYCVQDQSFDEITIFLRDGDKHER
ncbi:MULTISPECIES: segregation/condensation protein A [Shouchella]|uniref:Segregation and condensation protein A n=2 Tax=Shouchella TaxID=2893057 RepID=A0ABY7W5A6_9BACI|nr:MULTISPECIES: segregation/condensation protein A [Shouchella]MED4127140.1 segregation/condensation protein A [Shouchella miscanthi]WDF03624.1 segregation/condensation protein A [Shouchella hunanensis]GAF23375.1 segregation and condensation protein A [Bacillus sp. JCM 19047]